MKGVCLKRQRLRLDPDSYRHLCQQVLKRDGWCCQRCGCRTNLQVHHLQWRSQMGEDQAQNLITLCVSCHATMHAHRIA